MSAISEASWQYWVSNQEYVFRVRQIPDFVLCKRIFHDGDKDGKICGKLTNQQSQSHILNPISDTCEDCLSEFIHEQQCVASNEDAFNNK